MSIESNKLMNLADGKLLYDDLRERVEDRIEAPSTPGSSGQVLTSDGQGGQSWQTPTGGDPTEIIDDTAGAGDTDKVWSADKAASENALKQDAPETAGTAGQVLGLDANLDPVWTDQTGGSDDEKAPVIVSSASGAIASFADGADGMPVKDCVVSIEPVQDLHGYDNPWPAGGGKNKLPLMTDYTLSNNGVSCTVKSGVITLSGTSTAEARLELPLDATVDLSPSTNKIAFCNTTFESNTCTVYFTRDDTTIHYWGLSTANRVASGWTDSGNENVNKIIVVIAANKSASGTISPMLIALDETDLTFAPYSNVCPISGWTGCNVTQTGKNLLNLNAWDVNESLVNNGLFVIENGKITLKTSSYQENNNAYKIPKLGTYTLSFKIKTVDLTNNASFKLSAVLTDNTVSNLKSFPLTSVGYEADYSISISNTVKEIRFGNWGYSGTVEITNIQLELGSSASPYVLFGTTIPISWQTEAGTLYGGSLNGKTGVLTVDRASIQYTGSGATYDTSVASPRFYFTATGFANSTDYSHTDLSNVYVNANGPLSPTATSTSFSFYGQRVYIRDLQYDSITAFNAFATQMANNGTPLTFVGRLREAVTYQLTPIEIKTLLGQNNIWADCGNAAVDYCADTKAYVDDAIPAVPVQDVKVNGTSILSQGVANVPVASSSALGVVKVNGNGIRLVSSGTTLATDYASATQIKAGTNSYNPIVPNYQHNAVFYGLAKLAGADMASSSNAVGIYTDAAKVAIQKMLGIYEAPWELIREDTFTNATSADHIITVDGNGQAFELTDVRMLFEFPKVDAISSSSYGQIWFYYGEEQYIIANNGSAINRTAATDDAKGVWDFIEYENGMVVTWVGSPTTHSNATAIRNKFVQASTTNADSIMGMMIANNFAINKISIKGITGTGHYKLYGRRKWN